MKENVQPIEQLRCALPFFEGISAGFPSPAADYMDKKLDLNELCIKNPAATFFIRVQGDSMQGAGIFNNDVLVVDRSVKATVGSIIVAVVESEFLVKRYLRQGKFVVLAAENLNYTPIIIEPDGDFQVWGVVTSVIHQLNKK